MSDTSTPCDLACEVLISDSHRARDGVRRPYRYSNNPERRRGGQQDRRTHAAPPHPRSAAF